MVFKNSVFACDFKKADVRSGKFTSICTHFSYQDMPKCAMIYQDRVLRENA